MSVRQELVSVVIPLYDKAKYIGRAIDSVLAQTHRDWELLVVDDGSTDGGGDVVRAYNESRIRLVVQENQGKCVARNRGVALVRSELVAFLDADDEWLPDFLETVLRLRMKFPDAAVWGTAYLEMKENGETRGLKLDADTRKRKDGFLVDFFQFSLSVQQPINASSMMVKKNALVAAGGFPEGLARLGDTVTLFRIALRYPIAFCPSAKAIYHMEAENRTDGYYYSGNFPFLKLAKESLAEGSGKGTLSKEVYQYIGYYQTGNLYPNLIAGNREAIREIVRECGGIPGYRLRCLWWGFLVRVPQTWITLYVSSRVRLARLAGRSGRQPRIRSLYATRQC